MSTSGRSAASLRTAAHVGQISYSPATNSTGTVSFVSRCGSSVGGGNQHLAETEKLWVSPQGAATDDPDVILLELTVGSATLRHSPAFIADTYARLIA